MKALSTGVAKNAQSFPLCCFQAGFQDAPAACTVRALKKTPSLIFGHN